MKRFIVMNVHGPSRSELVRERIFLIAHDHCLANKLAPADIQLSNQYQRASPAGRFLKRFIVRTYTAPVGANLFAKEYPDCTGPLSRQQVGSYRYPIIQSIPASFPGRTLFEALHREKAHAPGRSELVRERIFLIAQDHCLASKLAPTGIRLSNQYQRASPAGRFLKRFIVMNVHGPGKSELVRERIFLIAQDHCLANKLAPTGIRLSNQYQRASPAGRFLKRFIVHIYWLGYARTYFSTTWLMAAAEVSVSVLYMASGAASRTTL